ncbi:MAG: hypothetical protein GF320_11530, partial [Armatimonadia bacterium]|nr:hypothetical protein [Armatimonadia bacterium]
MAIDDAGVWRESGRRTRFLRVGFLAVMALIAVRLVIIQGLQHDHYLQRYEEVARQSIELHARRGTVTDRVGRELAVDRPAIAVYVHPDRLQDVRGTSERLGAILGMDPEEIRQRILDCPDPFMYVDRQVDASLKPQIIEVTRLEPKGVGTEPATRRVYPKGALAADLLGFTGIEHTGLAGLEATFEPRLHGKAGLAVG